MAKRARWDQLGLTKDCMINVARIDFAELALQRYSFRQVHTAWLQSMAKDPGYTIGLDVLRNARKLFKRRACHWHLDPDTTSFISNIYKLDIGAISSVRA